MEAVKSFSLPKLPYGYGALAPYMSEQQLMIHHDKHHMAYVNGANAIFEKLDKARKENTELDMKATLKELSFHAGGHMLRTTTSTCTPLSDCSWFSTSGSTRTTWTTRMTAPNSLKASGTSSTGTTSTRYTSS